MEYVYVLFCDGTWCNATADNYMTKIQNHHWEKNRRKSALVIFNDGKKKFFNLNTT